MQILQETLTEKEAKAMEEKHAGGKKKSVHHAEEKNALIDAVAAIAIGEREKNLQVLVSMTISIQRLFVDLTHLNYIF